MSFPNNMPSSPEPSEEQTGFAGIPSGNPQDMTSDSATPPSSDKCLATTKPTKLFLIDDQSPCYGIDNHKNGEFCPKCGGIQMPWGGDLPYDEDEDGHIITLGPPGSILRGVGLQDPEAIVVVSAVTSLIARGLPLTEIPGLLELMDEHPESVKAGKRIARIYHSIIGDARNEAPGVVPKHYEIVLAALVDPRMNPNTYKTQVKKQFRATKQAKPKSSASHSPDGTSGNDDEATDYEPDSDSDDDSDDGGPDGDFIKEETWKQRPRRTENDAHAPGPKGANDSEWEWVPGTDFSMPELGKWQPHHFFMVRRHKNDSARVDVREYTGISGFDFDCENDIAKLRKAKKQIIARADKTSAVVAGPWTFEEKEALIDILNRFKAKNISEPLDWERVSADMVEKFKNRIQKKGIKLARASSKNKDGTWKPPPVMHKSLQADRPYPHRGAGAIRAQAGKYPDVAEIFKGMCQKPPVSKKAEITEWTDPGPLPNKTPVKSRRKGKKSAEPGAEEEEGVQTPETSKKRGASEVNLDESAKKKAKTSAKSPAEKGNLERVSGDVFMLEENPFPNLTSRSRGEKGDDKPSITESKINFPPPPPPPPAGTAA